MAGQWKTRRGIFCALRSVVNRGASATAAAIRARFAPLGGVELPAVPRDAMRVPPNVEE